MPADSSNITVGPPSNTDVDYHSVQSAIVNSTDGTRITIEPGTYREILFNRKARDLIFEGNTTEQYGADVIIAAAVSENEGNSSGARAVFYNRSSSLIILKNITITNDYSVSSTSAVNTYCIYVNNGQLAAYNCGFNASGKSAICVAASESVWVYDCYIECIQYCFSVSGSKPIYSVLAENCVLVLRKELGSTSYGFSSTSLATFDGDDNNSIISKGAVFLNSKLITSVASTYLTTSQSTLTRYINSAFINCELETEDNGTIVSDLLCQNNGEALVFTDSDGNLKVGLKTYNNSGFDPIETDYAIELSDDEYDTEYSDRYVILERGYDLTNEEYTELESWGDTLSEIENEFGIE